MIDMDLPAEGDVGFAVSEEVIQSALRVWHKETLADLTFVRKAKVSTQLIVKWKLITYF